MAAGMRLGLLGAGGIAEFHAPAFREAGFQLSAVCGLPDSSRARDFAARHGVEQTFHDSAALLEARDAWDALVVLVPIEPTLDVLIEAVDTGAPVLVEKPVALRAADLTPLLGRDLPVQVAYNRRFYRTATVARDEVRNGPPVLATITLPEVIGADEAASVLHFFANSVHGLDLIRYVVGDLEVVAVERLRDELDALCGIGALLRSPRGDIVQVIGNWGTPANYAITIDRPGRRTELRPLESASVFEEMAVVHPTPEVPIRTYRPQLATQIALDPHDVHFKPGFLAQAEAFARLCRGQDPAPAARLEDAHAVLSLAESLAGRTPVDAT